MSAAGHGEQFTVGLTLQDGYAFTVDFSGQDFAPLTVDEPPPLGQARGPNPARLLAAAVGSCLSASLLFCLRKSHVDVAGLRTTVDVSLVRNERGRLRIGGIRVRLAPELAPEQRERIGRCLALFQDFCIVTESVREGIAVDVDVQGVPLAAGV
jgi:organic hydroperoxide reductase OsmC/OhrA